MRSYGEAYDAVFGPFDTVMSSYLAASEDVPGALGIVEGSTADSVLWATPGTFARTEALSGKTSSAEVRSMAQEMEVNGWQWPPLNVVKINDELIVVDGHHRLAAAKRAGIEVPYVIVDSSTVIGPGQWSSEEDILNDAGSVGPDRLR